jgi:adenylate cyclase
MRKEISEQKKELFEFLDERVRKPSEREKIDRIIKEKFERNLAVMVTDSARFSLKTVQFGIVQFLSVLKRINDQIRPIMRKNKGKILCEEADNFVIVFKTTSNAINAGVEVNRYLRDYNSHASQEDKFEICIGIGYGPVLFVGDDVYGNEVNLASKLGEDIAEKGEILITEGVYDSIKEDFKFEIVKFKEIKISDVSFKYYSVKY